MIPGETPVIRGAPKSYWTTADLTLRVETVEYSRSCRGGGVEISSLLSKSNKKTA